MYRHNDGMTDMEREMRIAVNEAAIHRLTHKRTNADRIRAMSDEELVVFLDGFSGRCLDCAEDAKNKNCPIYKEGHYCRPKDIMEWLQMPAEKE